MERMSKVQLGKQGVTDNFIATLKNHFKKSKIIKISVLKSARKDKSKVKQYAEEIVEKLGKNYGSRIIGFTIVLRKFRKEIR